MPIKKLIHNSIKLDKYEEEINDEIRLLWEKDDKCCILFIGIKTNKSVIEHVEELGLGVEKHEK